MKLFVFFVVFASGIPIGLALGAGLPSERQNRILWMSMMLSVVATYCVLVAGPFGILHSGPIVVVAVIQIWRARNGTATNT